MARPITPWIVIPLALIIMQLSSSCSIAQPSADLVLVHGNIYTVDAASTSVEALAIRDGAIVFVGSSEQAMAHVGPATSLWDLQGKTVLPGLHDSHIHILEAFHEASGTCVLGPANSPEQWIPTLRACAPRQVGTDWVLGWGHSIWDLTDHIDAGGRWPVDILDDAIDDRPAVILEQTSHSVWANSQALAAAGIDRNTADPPGGRILRDPAGNPNGILLDGAGELLLDMALAPNPELRAMNVEALRFGLQEAARHGITSLVDARGHWQRGYVEAYQEVEATEGLTARVVVSLWAYPYLDDTQQIEALKQYFSDDPTSWLRFSQVKVYSDGELNQRTAALLEPYHCCELAGPRGLQYFDQTRLERYLRELGPLGFDFHIHAIGDHGVHSALNAIEAEQLTGARHRLTHLEMVQPNDIPRFQSLGVIADIQTSSEFSEAAHAHELDFLLGRDRIDERSLRLRDLYEGGARIVLSSDYDVGELSPFAGMRRALTRGDQSLPDLDAAIRAYTIDAAYLMRQEDRVGSLEVGKRADLVILDRNPFTIPPQQLDRVRVEQTLVDGELVFGPDLSTPGIAFFDDGFEGGDLERWSGSLL